MQIDWLTVTAQIANFLVLAWLLHRFLYGPITRAMERREQRIAHRLSDAEQKREEAESEARAFRSQQEELEQQREQFLADAQEKADQERNRLHQEARDEIDRQKKAWLNEVEQQRAEFLRDIRQRAREHFYQLARRALGDLADAQLEEQMSGVFGKKLAALDPDAKNRVADAGRKTGNGATVRSGFEMSPDAKREITKTIQDEILAGVEVTFEQNPDVICGLELKMGGQTVAWSLDSYFEALEKLIGQDLGELSLHAD
jgi:F-type H+-transporting ATPase subunit b